MSEKQTKGRKMNGAMPGGKPDAATSDEDVKRTGLKARKAAGPDGPDATVVGDTFKTAPGETAPGKTGVDEAAPGRKPPGV